jgi:nucleotide-binding universal stress UspA family protein
MNYELYMIERILCALDFSEFSRQAFQYAVSLAGRFHSRLFLDHVIEPVTLFSFDGLPGWAEMYDDFKTSAEGALAELITPEVARDFQPEKSVDVGGAADCILKRAGQKKADLIVMGIHGRGGADRLVIGSVTDKVLRKSTCPVLAVRSPAQGGFRSASQDGGLAFKKILLASDFSENARRAMTYALTLRTVYDAELVLAHVLESAPQDQDLRSETERLARELESSVPADVRDPGIHIAVRVGKPYREIIQLATESEADLIVLGGRGRSSVLDIAVFGSTAHRVLQLGPCSVLSVH